MAGTASATCPMSLHTELNRTYGTSRTACFIWRHISSIALRSGQPGGGQLRGGACASFPGACRTAASGLRWRFRVFLPPAVQGGSVGIRIAYLACFKTLPHVLTYTVQYWVVFINMFHTAHPICGMGQCNGTVFATCRLRNLSVGVSEDAGVLENVTYLLVAPDMWHG